MAEIAVIGMGFVVVNLIILGFNLKLYTEVFKENAQKYRSTRVGKPSALGIQEGSGNGQ